MFIIPALQLSFPSQKRFCFVCLKHFLLGRKGPCFSKRAVIAEQLLAFVSKKFCNLFFLDLTLSYFPRQNLAVSFIHEYSKAVCMGTVGFCVQPPHSPFEIWASPFPCSTWQDCRDLENYQLADLTSPPLSHGLTEWETLMWNICSEHWWCWALRAGWLWGGVFIIELD